MIYIRETFYYQSKQTFRTTKHLIHKTLALYTFYRKKYETSEFKNISYIKYLYEIWL